MKRQRHRANDHSLRLKRDLKRWQSRNRDTLVITTVAEREAAAAEAARPLCAGCGARPRRPLRDGLCSVCIKQRARAVPACEACGKPRAPSRTLKDGVCHRCAEALDCLAQQMPGADRAAVIVELQLQRSGVLA